jgi:hypothetical protein
MKQSASWYADSRSVRQGIQAFYGTGIFIVVLRKARHEILSQVTHPHNLFI